MRLSGEQAAAFCRSPDPALVGALLHGEDEGPIATRRRELVQAVIGDDADAMQVERLDPANIRRDPAALDAAVRARAFFGGRRVILVEGATDALAEPLELVLRDIHSTDAFVVMTAGTLKGKSSLRRLFEGSKSLISLQINAEALDAQAIASRLGALDATAGISDGARDALVSLANGMDPAAFDRFLETVALYALGANRPLSVDDVAALAPSGLDAEVDAFIMAVAGGHADAIGSLLRRVAASGATPVGLLIALQRHFRQLLVAASSDGGTEAALGRIRPPLWGARRDAVRSQLSAWRRDRLEAAARLLFEADGRVRSAEKVPAMAMVERCALRLALMAGR